MIGPRFIIAVWLVSAHRVHSHDVRIHKRSINDLPKNLQNATSLHADLAAYIEQLVEAKDSKATKPGEDSELLFEFSDISKVHYKENCSPETPIYVENNEVHILSSRPQPEPYSCFQTYRARNHSNLELDCYSMDFRFSCEFESLQVTVGSQNYLKCGKQEKGMRLQGNPIEVQYVRGLFGLHGAYSCILIARAVSEDYEECGKSKYTFFEQRIVGGVEAAKNEFPWIALLQISKLGFSYLCGGTLVNANSVITAAHCLEDAESVNVGLGAHDRQKVPENGSVWYSTTKFKIHPDYDPNEVLNDIAIVVLPSPVQFTDIIRPICLPSFNDSATLIGREAVAVGWGSETVDGSTSRNLQKVSLEVWSPEQCKQAWDSFKVSIEDSELCAYAENKDTCKGDSGGPLLVQMNGKWVLIGITAYGIECAYDGVPGVYTRVTAFESWINNNI